MDSFAKLKRRTTDLVESASKNLPSMPKVQLPNMSNLPNMNNLSLKSNSPAMKGTWQHISIPPLPRSSHSLDVVAGSAYVFGGEVEPRKPVDNDMHIINLPISGAPGDYYSVKAKASLKTQLAEAISPIAEETATTSESKEPLSDVPLASPPVIVEPESVSSAKGKSKEVSPDADVPSARVGHATAVVGSRIFLFGGRSAASETLDEYGRVWVFETKTQSWSFLDPATSQGSLVPPARSYHTATATDKPRDFAIPPPRRTESWKEWAEGDSAAVGIPQRPITGHVAASAIDEEDAGFGTFIIHGGCLADGSRTNDVWAFDIRSRIWKQLPGAPGAPRGGAALAIAKSRLYRFGGFDGESECGGQLDVLELGVDRFDDRVSKGEVGVFARGDWVSLVPPTPENASEQAGLVVEPWPGARSVAGMHLVFGGGGREYLLLVFGERSPSNDGHEAAGSFWGDVWAYQVPPLGMTPASFADAMLQAVGRRTGEGRWTKVTPGPFDDEVRRDVEGPAARGWFASAAAVDYEEGGVVLLGGVDESNRRLSDGWVFRLG